MGHRAARPRQAARVCHHGLPGAPGDGCRCGRPRRGARGGHNQAGSGILRHCVPGIRPAFRDRGPAGAPRRDGPVLQYGQRPLVARTKRRRSRRAGRGSQTQWHRHVARAAELGGGTFIGRQVGLANRRAVRGPSADVRPTRCAGPRNVP